MKDYDRMKRRWFPFDSSRVRTARYDKPARKLYVMFHGGAIYEYDDVHPNTARAFVRSASPGRFVTRYLEQHAYRPVATTAKEAQ